MRDFWHFTFTKSFGSLHVAVCGYSVYSCQGEFTYHWPDPVGGSRYRLCYKLAPSAWNICQSSADGIKTYWGDHSGLLFGVYDHDDGLFHRLKKFFSSAEGIKWIVARVVIFSSSSLLFALLGKFLPPTPSTSLFFRVVCDDLHAAPDRRPFSVETTASQPNKHFLITHYPFHPFPLLSPWWKSTGINPIVYWTVITVNASTVLWLSRNKEFVVRLASSCLLILVWEPGWENERGTQMMNKNIFHANTDGWWWKNYIQALMVLMRKQDWE